jgi:deazaflavin-dependent oxidoreductase (nitroreductase family)
VQIVLTTTGARTGTARPVTLYAWEDGDELVIVGSQGGAPNHPGWVHNLRANPHATIAEGKWTHDVVAREVTLDPERARLWDMVVDRFPLYATYQKRAKRRIPLFALTRAGV